MPQLSISPSGEIIAIYSDELVELIEQGEAEITRASEVEPISGGRWLANMWDGSQGVLGPFRTRGEALAAEVAYLENKLF